MTNYYVMLDTSSVTTSRDAGVDHPLNFTREHPNTSTINYIYTSYKI